MENLPAITDKLTPDVLLAMAEVQQSRSPYQIEKFVINQHSTPEMQYFQCLTELQSLYYTIKTVTLELQIQEIKAKKLRETGDEVDALEAEKLELNAEQTRLAGVGAFRELDVLLGIFNSFDKKYTRKEIDQNQEQYWKERINRQNALSAITTTPNQAAHLESLIQMGELKYETPTEGENQWQPNQLA
jgi:hypothetical protein